MSSMFILSSEELIDYRFLDNKPKLGLSQIPSRATLNTVPFSHTGNCSLLTT